MIFRYYRTVEHHLQLVINVRDLHAFGQGGNEKWHWFAEPFIMKCQKCKQERSCYTNERTVKKSMESFFDVNIRSVHAGQGIGHSGLSQMCASTYINM